MQEVEPYGGKVRIDEWAGMVLGELEMFHECPYHDHWVRDTG
jgi:hypothetical protein